MVMKGVNDDELGDFVELTRHLPVDVRFIEYMPFGENEWSDNKFLSYKDMAERIRTRYQRCTTACEQLPALYMG